MERHKVLHIISGMRLGGAEKLLSESLPLYNRKGIQTDLLVFTEDDSFFLDELTKGEACNIIILRKRYIYNPLTIFKLIPFLRRYDIVHVHLFPALYFAAIAKRIGFARSKLIYTEHSTNNGRRGKKWLRVSERLIYNTFHRIIGISDKTAEGLAGWLDNKKISDKICVINNGIDLGKYEEAAALSRKDLDLPDNARILLMVARFSPQKDQKTLIKAFSMLEDEDLYLLFAGEGDLREEAEMYAEKMNLGNRVRFLGARQDVPSIIKSSDICILSSHWEGFGLSAAECMAAGRPVIASDVDGLREVVKGGGLLFAKGDAAQLRDTIRQLLDDRNLYELTAKRCSEKAKEYGLEKMVDSYIDVYSETLS